MMIINPKNAWYIYVTLEEFLLLYLTFTFNNKILNVQQLAADWQTVTGRLGRYNFCKYYIIIIIIIIYSRDS